MSRALDQAVAWLEEGHDVALVSVTAVEGSTPRVTGPAMAVLADGSAVGSVSAGCVDGEAHALAMDALAYGRRASRRYAGPSDNPEGLPADLADLGPTIMCGGAMTVSVDPLCPADLPRLRAALRAERDTRPSLVLYGAGDVTADLTRLGAAAGRRVLVVDRRAVFATPQRFPEADEVVVDQPDRHLRGLVTAGRVREDTAIVVLAHDAAVEDPLLEVALTSPAGYVGALGSRRTHRARLERLRSRLDLPALQRLRGPVGLDLGGVTGPETAVSILAEIIAVARGGTGVPLSETDRPIHGASVPVRGAGAGVHCPD